MMSIREFAEAGGVLKMEIRNALPRHARSRGNSRKKKDMLLLRRMLTF